MNENVENVIEPFDITGYAEKKQKYGDPQRNFKITAIVIVIAAIILWFIFNRECRNFGVTAVFSKFYPKSALVYADVSLSAKNLKSLNESVPFRVNNSVEFLEKFGYYPELAKLTEKERRTLEMNLGSSFSFGRWYIKNPSENRYLAIFELKRKVNADVVFRSVFANGRKLYNKTYKGYRIWYFKDSGPAYIVDRDKLFIADTYYSLAFIVNNFFVKHNESLKTTDRFRSIIKKFSNDRLASVYVKDSSDRIKYISGLIAKDVNTDVIVSKFDATGISVSPDKDFLRFDIYTVFNSPKIPMLNIFANIKNIFNGGDPVISSAKMPDNTIGFLAVRGVRDIFKLYMDMSHLSANKDYIQIKELFKQLTRLDFENDVLGELNSEALMLTVNVKGVHRQALVLHKTPNTSDIRGRLLSSAPLKDSGISSYKMKYRNLLIVRMSGVKIPFQIGYADINDDVYALGEMDAIKALIDANVSSTNLGEPVWLQLKTDDDSSLVTVYANLAKYHAIMPFNSGMGQTICLKPVLRMSKYAYASTSISNNAVKTVINMKLQDK